MIIDMHGHVGDLRSPGSMDHEPLTIDNLIEFMDEQGIDKAALLPWPACPEAVTFPGAFSPLPDVVTQVRAAAERPDRLILFGNADPRWGGNSATTDFSWMFERFIEMGCVGMGEVSANIYFDDPRTINFFRQCGEWDLPVTIESTGPGEGHYGFIDVAGTHHLARLLHVVPETTVIGHGPGFWADIGSGVTCADKSGYPRGPILEEGAVPKVMRSHPNLYADISAGSGYNALTRDREFGIRFINEFQDRLMFGTDICFADPAARPQQLPFLRGLLADGSITQEVFDKLTFHNAARVMKRWSPE